MNRKRGILTTGNQFFDVDEREVFHFSTTGTPYSWQQDVINASKGPLLKGICLWSRRMGKDFVMWGHVLLRRAMEFPGTTHIYIFPTYDDALRIIRDGMAYELGIKYIDFIPSRLIARSTRKPLTIELINGSTIIFCGAGGAKEGGGSSETTAKGVMGGSLGADYKTVVFTEAGTMDNLTEMYNIVAPATGRCKGQIWFVGTPRGKNAFYRLWKRFTAEQETKPLQVFASKVTCDQFYDKQTIEDLKSHYSDRESLWEQEMFCSFEVARENTVFGAGIRNKIVDPNMTIARGSELYASIDFGTGTSMAIWIFTKEYNKYKFLAYYGGDNKSFDDYIVDMRKYAEMLNRRIKYIFVPHDSTRRCEYGLYTREDFLRKNGLNPAQAGNLGIDRREKGGSYEMVRLFLLNETVDFAEMCEEGLDKLKMYTYKCRYTGDLRRDSPYAHAADAFRYAVTGMASHGMLKITVNPTEEVLKNLEKNRYLASQGFSFQ